MGIGTHAHVTCSIKIHVEKSLIYSVVQKSWATHRLDCARRMRCDLCANIIRSTVYRLKSQYWVWQHLFFHTAELSEAACFVIYWSSETGFLKGVCLSFRFLWRWITLRFGLQGGQSMMDGCVPLYLFPSRYAFTAFTVFLGSLPQLNI